MEVITNGYDHDDIVIDTNMIEMDPEKFIIRHVGAMNKDRNHDSFWKGIRRLKEDPAFKKELFVELIGKNDASVRESVIRYGLQDTVSFISYVSHEEIGGLLHTANLLYLPINNTPNAKAILTGKLFEYIASGTPVLGIGPKDGDAAMVLKECGAGVMVGFDEEVEIPIKIFSQVTKLDNKVNSFTRKNLTKLLAGILKECDTICMNKEMHQ